MKIVDFHSYYINPSLLQTVFEAKMNTQGGPSVASEVMSKKRAFHSAVIAKVAKSKAQIQADAENNVEDKEDIEDTEIPSSQPKKRSSSTSAPPKKKKKTNFVDEEFFLSNFSSENTYSEKGYPC